MNVNEKANRPGTWTIDLAGRGDSGTPLSLLRDIRAKLSDRQTFVVVFPSEREPGSENVADAEYIGILETSDGKRSFGGAGVMALLGTDDGHGPVMAGYEIADTLANWVTAVAGKGGFGVGTVTDPLTSTSTTYLYKVPDEVSTAREQLDKICRYFGVQWRIIGDKIHAGTSAVLFPTRDRIITDELDGPTLAADVMVEPAVVLTPDVDASEIVNQVDVYPATGGPYAAGNFLNLVGKLDGGALESIRAVDAYDEIATDGPDIASRLYTLWSTPRTGHRKIVTSRGRIWSRLRVGSRMWEWFPSIGVSDTGNVVHVGDEIAFPVARVVSSMTVSLEDTWAVYLFTNPISGSDEWVDLSPWVKFGDGRALISTADSITIPSDVDRFGYGSLKARVV